MDLAPLNTIDVSESAIPPDAQNSSGVPRVAGARMRSVTRRSPMVTSIRVVPRRRRIGIGPAAKRLTKSHA